MLKILGSTESKIRPGEGEVGVGSSRAGREGNKLDRSELHSIKIDGGEVKDGEVGKKVQKRSKSKSLSKFTLDFLTPRAKLTFTKLRQAFLKALIFYHFNPECYIWIEIDASGYAIGGVLSQLTSDNSGRCHPIAFFSQKMILIETRYETYDSELLAIIKAFKTWRYYLKGFWHGILVLTNHNNFRRFIDIKNLSSKQVYWAQELSCYYFQINYCQSKANGAADALFLYL